MPLDSVTLKSFISLAETKNFTKTADKVGRTQSAISQQITKLEKLIGKTLFHREGELVLTHYGEQFFLYAQKIFHLQNEAMNCFKPVDVKLNLTIGLPEEYASVFLLDLMNYFKQHQPNVRVQIECDLTVNIINRFRLGEFDVCVIKEIHGEQMRNNAYIAHDELKWVGCKGMDSFMPGDEVPLILSTVSSVYRTHGINTLNQQGFTHKMVLSSSNLASKIKAVTAGLGVTIIQSLMMQDYPALEEVTTLPRLGLVDLCVMTHKKSSLPKEVIALIARLLLRRKEQYFDADGF